MKTNKNIKHLSKTEILLYCDKELGQKEMLKLKKHIETCESCGRLVAEAQKFSKLLHKAIEDNLSTKRKEDCRKDIDLSAYLEKKMTLKERKTMEEHLSRCNYCLSVLAETEKFLKGEVREKPPLINEKIMEVIKQQLREKKGESLFGKLTVVVNNSPFTIKKSLEKIKNNIESLLKNTFTYPSPHFAPVFGEHRATVLNPFGKVRYPVIFEWMPYKGADCYTISVEDTDWSLSTTKTKVVITPQELRLDYGKEYMWELKVMKGKKVIDEITGFFTLATEDEIKELIEIEKQLKSVEPEQDKFILWAGIFEEKGLYMEAIEQYKDAYSLETSDGTAYRIAYCYDKLGLEELRDEWNRKITKEEL
ncbi:hypothetical protein HY990_00090 [Candidatus Micrarchaeota archaeon]|nr:hypothetical protein [Candidatus Micrarchaeota archaeon]